MDINELKNKYMNGARAQQLWNKIKDKFATKDVATTSADGLMSSADKAKLDGVAENANKYVHPVYTAKDSGLYKVTVDGEGHVSATAAVEKSDITGLGIPAQDTVYTHPEHVAHESGMYKITVDDKGHVSAATAIAKDDITGLGIPAQDTVYTHPAHDAHTSGLYKITVDGEGHVSGVEEVKKADIEALGINGDEPISYPVASSTADGLMAKEDKSKLDSLPTNASLESTYAKKADITNVYKFQGSVATEADLPSEDLTAGDVYSIEAESSYGAPGMNVGWTGEKWDNLGGLFSIDAITEEELDAICV